MIASAANPVPGLDELPGAVVEVDAAWQVVRANVHAHGLFAAGPGQLDGQALAYLLVDGPQAVARAAASGTPARAEARRRTRVPLSVDVRALPRDGGGHVLLLCELHEAALSAEAERLFGPMFDNSPVGMAVFDSDGRYVRVNDALCHFLRRERGDLLGRRDQELTHPDDRASDVAAAGRILDGELDTWQTEKRFLAPDGEVVWAIANLTFLRDDERRPLCWVGVFQDITRRKRLEGELRRLADDDALTGLHNLRLLHRELEHALAAARRHREPGAVLLLDLDGFKAVNDRHGHQAGDELLIAIAGALRARVRESDVLARLGGDEFAVLLPRASEEDAARVSETLAEIVDGVCVEREDALLRVTASIGVATFRGAPGECVGSLLAAADAAMYAVKRSAVLGRP